MYLLEILVVRHKKSGVRPQIVSFLIDMKYTLSVENCGASQLRGAGLQGGKRFAE